jgi:hypothetical protein
VIEGDDKEKAPGKIRMSYNIALPRLIRRR